MPEGEVVRGHSPALGLTRLPRLEEGGVSCGGARLARKRGEKWAATQANEHDLEQNDFMHEPSAPPGKSYSIMMPFSVAIRRFPVDRLIKRSSTRLVSGARDANPAWC